MRKKNIQLKVSFRKGGGGVTLSNAASFLSAMLNEGPELSFTSSLSQMQPWCMHTHQKRCTHAYTLSHVCADANCSKMLMPVIILETPPPVFAAAQLWGSQVRENGVPSWLLLIGQTDRLLPGCELTLTSRAAM